jgi:hypothetical protein
VLFEACPCGGQFGLGHDPNGITINCSVCWAKFSDIDGPDMLREGYTTGDNYAHGARYEWVCDECFAKLKDEMHWTAGSPA